MSPFRSKPESCLGCPCHGHGTDFMRVEGTGANGVMIVGEALGQHEQRDQLPFRPYANAGGILERAFARMGLVRGSFAISNALHCRPKNDWLSDSPWEYAALRHCRDNLRRDIATYRPRMIWALGNVALRELTGVSGVASEMQSVTHLGGYVLPASYDLQWDPNVRIPVIGDFHPAFLRRGKMSYFGRFCRTLYRALLISNGNDKQYMWDVDPNDRSTHGDLEYLTRPSDSDIRLFLDRLAAYNRVGGSDRVLAYDLETSESASLDEDAREGFADTRIRLAQFSFEAGKAIALGWDEHSEAIKTILGSPIPKCGHNTWLFDNKVLRANGVHVAQGDDTLQMFHHWQPDLPAHLQYAASFVNFPFPWKHYAGPHIEFYGCADADATFRLYGFLKKMLVSDGIWGDDIRGYHGQMYEVRPVLAGMEDRGVPVDDARRVELGAQFERAQGELGVEIAARAPKECQRIHPKVGYKTVPPQVKKWLTENNIPWNGAGSLGLFGQETTLDTLYGVRFQDPPAKAKDGSVEEGEWYVYNRRDFEVSHPEVDLEGNPVVRVSMEDRWIRVYDFNPNSPPQMVAYMKAKKHPVPKSKEEDDEGNRKDTTSAKELQRLAKKTGDDFYLKVIEYRGYTKLRGTYVDGFVPAKDGCVHTTFTFDTGIGQLSSRNPNVQNFTKLKPTPALAKLMREMIRAYSGYVILELDYKSCHALTLGYLAESPNYMRMARLDIHSYVAGHFLGLWNAHEIINEPDEFLRSRFKWLKSNPEWKRIRDDQAKHAILGIGNGLKAKGLYERYMENFPGAMGLKTAQKFLTIIEDLFPEVFEWQRRMQQKAHDDQLLKTEFGHIRRFYEVFKWDFKKQKWGHGDQAEEAISFWLSNIAFGHIREALKELERRGLSQKYGLFNNVHDSFMFHFPERMLDEAVAEIVPVLLAPSKVLTNPKVASGGLVVDVDASWGYDWGTMHEIDVKKNPTTPLITINRSEGSEENAHVR